MPSLNLVGVLFVAVAIFAGCGRNDDKRFRDTRHFVKARIELVGELIPFGTEKVSAVARKGLTDTWAERLKRLRDQGLVAVDSARFSEDGNNDKDFRFVIDVRVPPPCEPAATLSVGHDVWEVLANNGDFGVHAIDDALRSRAANFLRGNDAVTDVTTAATHRGLLIVKLFDASSGARILDLLGEHLAAYDGFAVLVPAEEVNAGKPSAEERLHLAVTKTAPAFDAGAIVSAEASPERDGFARVTVAFGNDAVPTLAALTEKELGRHVVILHDRGEFLAAPVIGSVVRDGRWALRLPAVIGPNRAESLAAVLGAGGLPVLPVLRVLRHGCVRDPEHVEWNEAGQR